MNDLILYTTEDGRSQIKLRAKDQTVWLSQREMAQLFDVSTDNVGLHLKNIVVEGELEGGSVTEESSVTAADGKQYLTKLYNLDAILAVGYRVRSPRGVQFRRWASIVLKADILVAKNYLTEDEIDTLNRLVVIFLETAELRAKSKQETRMNFWMENVNQIITSNGFPLLAHVGSISHEQMESKTNTLYLDYDQHRKQQEALEADQQDEAELKALENKIKRRLKK